MSNRTRTPPRRLKLAFEGFGIGGNHTSRGAFDDEDSLRYIRRNFLRVTRPNQCLEILISNRSSLNAHHCISSSELVSLAFLLIITQTRGTLGRLFLRGDGVLEIEH